MGFDDPLRKIGFGFFLFLPEVSSSMPNRRFRTRLGSMDKPDAVWAFARTRILVHFILCVLSSGGRAIGC